MSGSSPDERSLAMTAEARPPRALVKTFARGVAWAILGPGLMVLCAGLAWWIRGGMEPPSPTPVALAPQQPHTASAPDQKTALFKRGRLAYQVHCARCHGPEGRGDGPDAASLRPPPRDFASRPWSHGETPEAIRNVIRQGVPGTAMTAWSDLLAPHELDAVVDYVHSFRSPATGSETDPAQQVLLRQAGFEPVDPPIAAVPFSFEDLDGRKRTLDQDRGKAILLIFWGTTCAPCMEELPSLDRIAQAFADAPLAVLPICIDEPDDAVVREVARTRTKHLPLFVDRTGIARIQYDVQTIPCAVLIDSKGRQIGRVQGGKDWSIEPVQRLLQAIAPRPVPAE